jgi:predicted phage terminase large subunit-like protein
MAEPRIRYIPCPLCAIPTKANAFTSAGICPACSDARRDSKRAHLADCIDKDDANNEAAKVAYKRVAALGKRRVEQEKAAELEKKRRAAVKELTAVQKEQASLALARRSVLHYIERRKPTYKVNWFIEDMARRIEKFYDDIINERSPRLILTVPSRHGKSELASDSGVAWALGNWPQLSIVVASYSDDLPTKFSKSVRAQLQSDEFHQVFPNGGRISKTDAAAGAWLTTQGGGLKAVGCGGGLLGFGANALIMDDIIRSAEDADNPATLESAYDWMTSTAMSRLAPGGGILLIMQRLAPMDPVGRLHANQKEEEKALEQLRDDILELEGHSKLEADETRELALLRKEADELDASMDRYHTVIYPALAIQKEYLTPEGEIMRIADDREIQDDWKLLRMPGDALHPDRYSRNALLKLQRANSPRFQSMYMLDPIAEAGEYFKTDDFQRYDPGKHPKRETMHLYAAWDLAISTKTHADFTCGIAGGIDYNGNLWLLEMVHGRFGALDLVADLVIDLHTRWKCNMTGIEKTGIELALGPILRHRMTNRKEYIALAEGPSALRPIADKRVRARTLQAMCRQGKVHIPQGDMWDSFVAQCTQFPIGNHDDMVDAASWLAIMTSKDSLPQNPADHTSFRQRIKDAYASLFDKEEHETVNYMDS